VNRIVPAQHLEGTVREMVAMIADTAPLTFVAAKLASRAATDPQFRIMAQQAIDACFNSDDFKEGRAAFREKRQPRFTGK
jgi:enoyl-CoA hydratase/carnithine racemase